MTERMVRMNQFSDEGRRYRLTSLDRRLHSLTLRFGRENRTGHESLISARRAFTRGEGTWTDTHGLRHELSNGGLYTETIYQESKPDLGRDRSRNR